MGDSWAARPKKGEDMSGEDVLEAVHEAIPGLVNVDTLEDAVHTLTHIVKRQQEIIQAERAEVERLKAGDSEPPIPEGFDYLFDCPACGAEAGYLCQTGGEFTHAVCRERYEANIKREARDE